jgi:hypothetical protein
VKQIQVEVIYENLEVVGVLFLFLLALLLVAFVNFKLLEDLLISMVLWDSFCLNIVFYCVMGLFVRLTLFKIGLVLLFFVCEICLFWRN